MNKFKLLAAHALHEAFSSTFASQDEALLKLDHIQIATMLERPQKEEHGDLAFPCFSFAKSFGKNPAAIAKELANNFQKKKPEEFESIVNLGPYLNFKMSAKACFEILANLNQRGSKFGNTEIGKGKKVLIEYSSPNVAKELHIGHFRNTILGQSINNIYKSTGYTTIALNHLGDWGAQFGKVAFGFLKFGKEEELKENPVNYLTKLYVKTSEESEKNPEIDLECKQLFKKMENGDKDMLALWKRFCDLSIDGLKRIYARLGVQFDHYIGESFYFDKMPALIQELRDKKLLELSEGAQVVKMGEDEPPCLILTSEGTSLYATRDITAAKWRKEHFQFDKSLYVVGSEQQLHLKQVFAVLRKMGYAWAESLEHIHYGLYRFKDGKFSTRKGRVILAEEVIDEAKAKALELINAKNPELKGKESVAETIGLGAVIFNDLSTDRLKDVEFDWDQMLDFEGDTGPYIQYSHARACSILRSGATKSYHPKEIPADAQLLQNESAAALVKCFARLETSIEGALRLHKPSVLANYTLELAKKFNSFYRNVRVLDDKEPKGEIEYRLQIVKSFQQVLAKSLALLCIQAPEEM